MGLFTSLMFVLSIVTFIVGCGSAYLGATSNSDKPDTVVTQSNNVKTKKNNVTKVGNGSYNSKEINSIDLTWSGGNVEVIESTANNLSIVEEIHSGNVNENQKMHWEVCNGKLTVTPAKPGKNLSDSIKKDLRIYVPKRLKEFKIDLVASSIEYRRATPEEINFNLVGSNVKLWLIDCNKVEANGVGSKANIELVNGLGATVRSSGVAVGGNNAEEYGDGKCKINIKGTGVECNIVRT